MMTATLTATLAANLVAALHVAFVAAMALAPFSRSPGPRVAFLFVAPLLWVHWALGDSTCALTLLESWLRGVPPGESFMHRLVAPVYDIRDSTVRRLSWGASVALWAYAARRTTLDEVAAVVGPPSPGHSSASSASVSANAGVSDHSAYSSSWRA